MKEHLKDKQHYIDLYDLYTIKECLRMVTFCREKYAEEAKELEKQGQSKGELAKAFNWGTNQFLYVIKANRYRSKEEIIKGWIERDTIEQEKYDNTPLPLNIFCSCCKSPMLMSIKYLETLDNPMRMMFLFNCSSCKKKSWIYDDGAEREATPQFCPKCRAEVEMLAVKEGKDRIVWKTTCALCGFTETTVDDFKKSRAERKKQEEFDMKLLEVYRDKYCSAEKGKEAFEYQEALKVAGVVFDEEYKKFDSFTYQQVSRLKKLTVIDLEKLLNETFEKNHYTKLSFNNPEIGQQVIVSFSIQDADSSRKEDNSISFLQKTIKDALEGTNWRLMTDGLSYRLGYISGRLKGYEREEDFFALYEKKKDETSSKLDYETRMRYEGHNVVQIARISGEYKGIQAARTRRLEKEPEGFFLDSPEDTYPCGICGENIPGDKTWWNLDGMRCADCQRSIKAGVISSEVHTNSDIWIKDWELRSEFNVNVTKAKKLRKDGILHGRELKREDGTVYFTVYLLNENKEFLEKYPRNPRTKHYIIDLLGENIEL